jgi:hypothetical protein
MRNLLVPVGPRRARAGIGLTGTRAGYPREGGKAHGGSREAPPQEGQPRKGTISDGDKGKPLEKAAKPPEKAAETS